MFSRRSSVATNPDVATPHDPRSPSAGAVLSRKSSIGSHKSNLSRWSRAPSVAEPTSRKGSLDLSHAGQQGPRDPWRGHPGHLTEEQERKLAELKTTLGQDGTYDPAGPNANGDGHGKGDIPDGTLLRFLRARKFDVQGAAKQYTDFVRWRREKGVDEAYENYDVESFETLRAVYPMWTGRRDARGVPIYVYKISALTPSKLSSLIPDDEASSTAISVITFVLIRFLLPLCSSLGRTNEEVPVSGTSSIIDVGGVGLSRFWGLRSHLQVASQVASANFPETIDRVFVVGAPSFFPTVFNWAKKWFDPGTVEKIHILGSPTELQEFMPLDNIPKEYGGGLDWTYGQPPALGEVERAKLGADGDKLQGPICWDREESRLRYLGKEGGKRREGARVTETGPTGGVGSVSATADGEAVKSPSKTVQDAEAAAEAKAHKPASDNNKPLMASYIPTEGAPGVHSSSAMNGSTNGAPLVESPSSEAPPANEHHFANGTSPSNDPPHPPESGFIPGTHEPLTEERVRARSLPPAGGQATAQGQEDADDETQQKAGEEQASRIRNEAVAKGWIPGSGVTEQAFLRSVGGMTL